MKRIISSLVLIALAVSPLGSALAEEKKKPATESEKISYAIGLEFGSSLQNIREDITMPILIQGLTDSFNNTPQQMTAEEAAEVKQAFVAKMQAKMEKEYKALAETNLKKGNEFLAANKKKKGVVTTASGLQYIVVTKGDGASPAETDKVKAHYRGSLLDGTEFDSSYKRGEPAVFPVSGLIPGWTEALKLMKVGSKYRLFVPAELAYGERGAGGAIGPNETLEFEVELLGIEK